MVIKIPIAKGMAKGRGGDEIKEMGVTKVVVVEEIGVENIPFPAPPHSPCQVRTFRLNYVIYVYQHAD